MPPQEADDSTANNESNLLLAQEQVRLPSFNDTFLLRLNSEHDRKDFQHYCEKTMMSYVSMFMVFFIYSVAWLTFAVAAIISEADSDPHPLMKCLAVMFGIWLILFAILLSIIYKKDKTEFLKNISTFAENSLMILGTVGMGVALVYRVQSGSCTNDKFVNLWHCNPYADAHALPQDFVVMLMIYPIIFPAIYQSIRFRTVIGCWLLNIVSVVIAINIPAEALVKSYTSLAFYAPASLILICDLQRQNLSTYFLSCQQKYLLAENVRLSEESQVEMRHMIGNVAHDLKTPLASLRSAVDMISGEVKELHGNINIKNSNSNSSITQSVLAIESFLTDVNNVNSFMLMTINRCIDFTKTSNGFKLVPKQETVNLANVLRLPMKCMNDMQKNIAVAFKTTIPNTICSHIITDKQWLQENMLCLLSNAVKYSNGGEVTVNVSLVDSNQNEASLNAKRLQIIAEQKASRELSTSISAERLVKNKMCEDSVVVLSGRIAAGAGNAEAAGPLTMDILISSSTDSRRKPPPHSLQHYIGRSKYRNNSSRQSNVKYKIQPTEQPPIVVESSSDAVEKGVTNVVAQPSREAILGAQDKAMLMFEIEDTGIGISEAVMAKLFTPFKQAQRHAGGTGLGLFSLARRIEALGGHYGVENRPDGQPGSLFWFTIPYRPDAAAGLVSTFTSPVQSCANLMVLEARPETTGAVKMLTSSSFGETHQLLGSNSKKKASLRMLVVDDSLAILKMTSMMLRKQGHTVTQAKNGAEALEILNKTLLASIAATESGSEADHAMFDVVLMDLQMPVMDGLEATRRYREVEKAANQSRISDGKSELHQLMISFSANSDDVTMSDALEIGFDAFIGKPFTLETFNAVCDKCFQVESHILSSPS